MEKITSKKPFQSPAFIVGCPRSGTTLLSAILNRHPDICVTPETNFLYLLSKIPNTNEGFKENWPQALYDIADSMAPTDIWSKPAKQIYDKLNGQPTTGKDAFLVLGQLIANKDNKPLWIEKTPNHVHCLPFIRQLFPKAPIINIIRDGRDVAYSLTKVKFGSIIYFENLLLWLNIIKKTREFQHKDKHIISIKYEDLILKPEHTIQQVCNFLSIPFCQSMLTPQLSDKTLMEKKTKHKAEITQPINRNKLAGWKNSLTNQLQKTAKMVAYNELINYNYSSHFENKTSSLYTSKLLLVSRHHRKLYDKILDSIANNDRSYILESVTTLTANNLHHYPDLWVTDEIPLPDQEQRKTYKNIFLYLLKLIHRLILLKITGTKLVWILHPEREQSNKWFVKKFSEFLMSKMASSIIVVTDNDITIKKNIAYYHLNHKKCLFSCTNDLALKLNILFL